MVRDPSRRNFQHSSSTSRAGFPPPTDTATRDRKVSHSIFYDLIEAEIDESWRFASAQCGAFYSASNPDVVVEKKQAEKRLMRLRERLCTVLQPSRAPLYGIQYTYYRWGNETAADRKAGSGATFSQSWYHEQSAYCSETVT